MPIECHVCHSPTRIVYYRSYSHYPRQVRIVRWLVVVAAVVSFYGAGHFFINLLPLFDASEEIAKELKQTTGEDELSQLLRDFSTFFSNAVSYIIVLVMGLLIYLPIQYALLLFRFRRGAPKTYWKIVTVAKTTLAINVFAWLTVVVLFSDLRILTVSPPVGLNLFIAPVILWQARRPIVKEYFSQFKWNRLPPAAPPDASFSPVEQAVAPEWMPVPELVQDWEPVPSSQESQENDFKTRPS